MKNFQEYPPGGYTISINCDAWADSLYFIGTGSKHKTVFLLLKRHFVHVTYRVDLFAAYAYCSLDFFIIVIIVKIKKKKF